MKALLLCLTVLLFCIKGESSTAPVFGEKNASWIKGCQGNRIYLNLAKMLINEEGIFAFNEDNRKVPITELYTDTHGVYTRAES